MTRAELDELLKRLDAKAEEMRAERFDRTLIDMSTEFATLVRDLCEADVHDEESLAIMGHGVQEHIDRVDRLLKLKRGSGGKP